MSTPATSRHRPAPPTRSRAAHRLRTAVLRRVDIFLSPPLSRATLRADRSTGAQSSMLAFQPSQTIAATATMTSAPGKTSLRRTRRRGRVAGERVKRRVPGGDGDAEHRRRLRRARRCCRRGVPVRSSRAIYPAVRRGCTCLTTAVGMTESWPRVKEHDMAITTPPEGSPYPLRYELPIRSRSRAG